MSISPDAARCPLHGVCESCGHKVDLAVQIVALPLGTMCVTLCRPCARDRAVPYWLRSAGAGRVSRHKQHIEHAISPEAQVCTY